MAGSISARKVLNSKVTILGMVQPIHASDLTAWSLAFRDTQTFCARILAIAFLPSITPSR
jgi:hypothetical protein